MHAVFSFLAGALLVIGYIPYIYAILRQGTKPSKASWVIWSTLDVVMLASMYAKDVINGQIIGAVMGSLIVVVLSFRYGTPGWTRLDKFCIIGTFVGIVLWQLLDNAMIGLLMSLSLVCVGAIPTAVSVWKEPRNESKLAWGFGVVSSACAVLSISQWTLASISQPIVFLVLNAVVLGIMCMRQAPKLASVPLKP